MPNDAYVIETAVEDSTEAACLLAEGWTPFAIDVASDRTLIYFRARVRYSGVCVACGKRQDSVNPVEGAVPAHSYYNDYAKIHHDCSGGQARDIRRRVRQEGE